MLARILKVWGCILCQDMKVPIHEHNSPACMTQRLPQSLPQVQGASRDYRDGTLAAVQGNMLEPVASVTLNRCIISSGRRTRAEHIRQEELC